MGINRNKRITDDIEALGDCHIGRQFKTGVPLDRRGEREERVWKDFETSLMSANSGRHIQVGDLFDAFVVPIEVVLRAADIYERAARANPNATYIVYAGNHDLSRTESRKSSFELFQRLLAPIDNISVVTDTEALERSGSWIGIVPWHPFKSAAELAGNLSGRHNYDIVFGHWDCKSFGGDDHNLIPLEQLAGKTKLVVTGHEHTPREFDHGDIHVVVVGSMQPFSHAEDTDGEFYVTMTLDEMAECKDDLSDRNVRLVLKEGEVIPAGLDALSVTTKTVESDAAEAMKEIDFDPSFDLAALLGDALREAGVEPLFTAKVEEKFGELRAEV